MAILIFAAKYNNFVAIYLGHDFAAIHYVSRFMSGYM